MTFRNQRRLRRNAIRSKILAKKERENRCRRRASPNKKKKKKKAQFICWDLETTSLRIKEASIVEIAAVAFNYNGTNKPEIVGTFQSLVKPLSESENTPDAIAVHGITNEMLTDAPSLDLVFPKFVAFIKTTAAPDFVFCGHNVFGYDMPILKRLAPVPILDGPIFDTLLVGRKLYKESKSKRLTVLYDKYCEKAECDTSIVAHRALSDVFMNVMLMCNELKLLDNIGIDWTRTLF